MVVRLCVGRASGSRYLRRTYSLPIQRGFKRGLPLSLEIQKPGGFWHAFDYFPRERKVIAVWSAELHNVLAKSSENGLCPFSGPHTEKYDNAESRGAVFAGTAL